MRAQCPFFFTSRDGTGETWEHRMRNHDIFTRSFIAAALINLLILISYYLLFAISSPYATERFGASPSTAGLIAGLMVLGCLAGRFVTGHFIAVLGFGKVLFTGIVIYTVSMALYLVAATLTQLVVVRFLSGVGIGCIGTVTGTIVAYMVPPAKRGQGVSYFSMSTILALAVGPFLGITLLDSVGYDALFLLCLLSGVLCLAIMPILHADRVSLPRRGGEGGTLFAISNFIDPPVVPFAIVVLLVCMVWGNVQAFMRFYAEETGLVAAAGGFFLAYAVVVFATRPFSGKLLDARGENVIVYPALLLTACAMFALDVAAHDWTLLLAGALMGAGFGNFQSTGQAVSLKLAEHHRFAQATSTFFIFLDFGIGFGPYLFGFLVPVTGYRHLFLVLSGVALLSVPLYRLLHGKGAVVRGAGE